MSNLNKGTIETYIKLLQYAYFQELCYENFKQILEQYDNSVEDAYYCEVVYREY